MSMMTDSVASGRNRFPGAAWVAVAFIPWILNWVFTGVGVQLYGVVLGLLASVLLNGYRALGRKVMVMDLVTLIYFAADFTFTMLGSMLFLRFGSFLVYLVLCGLAFGSITVRDPFTLQYAKEDWPKEVWGNRIFRSTNYAITGLWGVIFLSDAVLYKVGTVVGSVALSTILPLLLLGLGVAFSIMYPKWYPKYAIKKQLERAGGGAWSSPTSADGGRLTENEYDVAIVGSGIGELSSAALLAKRGLKVLVAEQHYLAGGYCTSFPRKGHSTFDAGVFDISGLGRRGPVRFLLRELGIENRLEFKRVTSEYVFPNMRLRVPHDWKDFVNLLAEHFPAEKENISAFFDEMKGVYDDLHKDVDTRNGVIGPPTAVEEMMRYPLTHGHLMRWLNKPYREMLDEYFTDSRLKEVLSTLTGYVTDDRDALQVRSMAPIFGYYFDGGYYPKHGSQAFADALVSAIKNNGGTVLLNTRIRRILVKDGAANGILVDSTHPRNTTTETYHAGIVISNADVKHTFLSLIEPGALPSDFLKNVQRIEPSASAFMVFLSLNYDPPAAPITLLTTTTGSQVQVVISSKLDSDLAAPGGSAMTLVTLVPHSEAKTWNREAPDYAVRKEKYMEQLIDSVIELFPDLRSHIIYKEAASPATFTRYTSSYDGAIYGPKLEQGLPFKSPIRNLYLVGSGTFPGAGIEAVVISALTAANDILPRNVFVGEDIAESTPAPAPYLTVQDRS